MAEAILSGSKILVLNNKLKGQLVEKGFGEKRDEQFVLSLVEAYFLLSKKKIKVEDKKGKKLKSEELIKASKEKNFLDKFLVYKDLRERGFVVKTGFKFGFDFRVYPRGKKPGDAHSQWVIAVKPQGYTCSFAEFSRKVRLAGNLRTTYLQAIVDQEGHVNYYEIKRMTP